MSYIGYSRPPHFAFRCILAMGAFLCLTAASLTAQDQAKPQDLPKPPSATQTPTPTHQQPETPRTAPQVKKVLPSYEGQNVSSIEVAGRPDIKTEDFKSLFAQKAGEQFSRDKVEELSLIHISEPTRP